MLGLYYALKDSKEISLHGIDISAVTLKKCRHVIEHVRPERIHLELRKHDASNGLLKTEHEYDVVVLANSLAEMFPDTAIPLRFVHRLFRNVHDAGIIIIIEPAIKQLARRLIDLRNEIIPDKKVHVLLPCLHDAECPLHEIRKHKEWCHQSITWQPPQFMDIINQGLHREISVLKFSYLVLAQENVLTTADDQYRVISNLLKEKGKQRFFICTRTGRVELVRLNRDRTECNSTFGHIKKGDVISCQHVTKRRTDYWQVVRASAIHIHHTKW
jgi:ribosomal protein RSM22 (predicted rRNA methylase)